MTRRYYVRQYGSIWSMSRARFLAFLRHGATGQEWNLDDFGKQVTRCPNKIYDARPLDWTTEQFESALIEHLSEVEYEAYKKSSASKRPKAAPAKKSVRNCEGSGVRICLTSAEARRKNTTCEYCRREDLKLRPAWSDRKTGWEATIPQHKPQSH